MVYTPAMLNDGKVVTFVATKDAAKARAFYEQTLGLRFVEDSPFALVFDFQGTMLRVQKVKDLTPAQFTVLGWEVPDIAASVKALTAKGVSFMRIGGGFPQDDLGIWAAPGGAKIAWFKDPDGNTLSLTQF